MCFRGWVCRCWFLPATGCLWMWTVVCCWHPDMLSAHRLIRGAKYLTVQLGPMLPLNRYMNVNLFAWDNQPLCQLNILCPRASIWNTSASAAVLGSYTQWGAISALAWSYYDNEEGGGRLQLCSVSFGSGGSVRGARKEGRKGNEQQILSEEKKEEEEEAGTMAEISEWDKAMKEKQRENLCEISEKERKEKLSHRENTIRIRNVTSAADKFIWIGIRFNKQIAPSKFHQTLQPPAAATSYAAAANSKTSLLAPPSKIRFDLTNTEKLVD